MNKVWFVKKRYGWGWRPVTWQGWIISFLYLLSLLRFFMKANANSHSGSDVLISFALPFIILTSIFIFICYRKGEKPEWQWGTPKQK
jgi:hypothetical protein